MKLAFIVACWASWFLIDCQVFAETLARPPNIVLMVADDLGYGELGCYGQKKIRTPHLDRLAQQGMRFTQFYSGQAVCAPSRCSLMTGKHQGHATIRDNGNPPTDAALKEKYGWEFPGQIPIPENEVTLPHLLHDAGYATGAMGKWGLGHVGTSGSPNKHGFDLFYGYYCQVHAHNHYPNFLWRNEKKEVLSGNTRSLTGSVYSQDRFIEEAISFVQQHRDVPFFLYLPFVVPHLSIQVPDASSNAYLGELPEAPYVHKGYLQHPTPRAGYAGMVTHMDAGIGKLVAQIDQLGLAENTLILFTSDNGPTYDRLGGSDSDFFESAGPLRGRKGDLLEGGIRVPLIARWTGTIQPATTSHHVAAFYDLLPTLCELSQIATPQAIDGLSFAATLQGKFAEQRPHDFLYWEFKSYGGQQAVRWGNWKGLRQGMLAKNNKNPLAMELYDLKSDIHEDHNIASDHPDVVAQIAKIMLEQHSPSPLFPFKLLDEQK